MKPVHYLVRKPNVTGELIYPVELEDERYQGYGSFFVDGEGIFDVAEAYVFYALREGNLFPVTIQRIGKRFAYQTIVEGIGKFIFRATAVGVPATYSGIYSIGLQQLLIRQLAPNDRSALESAAKQHDFYFVGFSPMLSDVFGSPLPEGPIPLSGLQDRRTERSVSKRILKT